MEIQTHPNLRSAGTIRPYRCVVVDTSADNTGVEAAAADAFVIGVADGSTKAFDNANHAETGDPISLQSGFILTAESGAAITRGARIATAADGQVVTETVAGASKMNVGIALESAGGADERIRIYFMPHANQV